MKKVKGNITEHLSIDNYGVNQTEVAVLSVDAMAHAHRVDRFIEWLNRKTPPTINAWWRSKTYNAKVGGVKNSLHLTGEATDLGMSWDLNNERLEKYKRKWFEICDDDHVKGEFGIYPWGVHLGSNIKYSKKHYSFDKRG